MKQGNAHKSFDELAIMVNENARKKLDCVLDTKEVCLSDHPVSLKDRRRHMQINLRTVGSLPTDVLSASVEPFAFDQMCQWASPGLGKYSRTLMAEGEDDPRGQRCRDSDRLIASNLNYFLDNPDDRNFTTGKHRRMFRLSKEPNLLDNLSLKYADRYVLYAFLSDSYLRLDDEVVLDALRPEVEKIKGLEIASLNCSRDFMHIKLTQPSLRREVKVGDVVESGIRVKNSGMGLSFLLLNDYVSRLTCLNGAVSDQISAGIKKLHRGSKLSPAILPQYHEDPELYGADYIPELRKQIAESIEQSLSVDHFDKLVDRLRDTTKTEELKVLDPQSDKKITIPALELVDKQFGLTSADKEKAFHNLKRDGDYTQWGFANAITRVANDHVNYDTASKLEEIGGKILAFRNPQWSQYVEAEFKKAA